MFESSSSKQESNIFDRWADYFESKSDDKGNIDGFWGQRWAIRLKTIFTLVKTLEILNTIDRFGGVNNIFKQLSALCKKTDRENQTWIDMFGNISLWGNFKSLIDDMEKMCDEEIKTHFKQINNQHKLYKFFEQVQNQNQLIELSFNIIVFNLSNDTIESILDNEPLRNQTNITGNVIIMTAATNQYEKLKYLIEAAEKKELGIAELLLFQPPILDTNSENPWEFHSTALHWAVFHKNLDMVKLIMATAKRHGCAFELAKKQNAQGNTPLHFAAFVPFMRGRYNQELTEYDSEGNSCLLIANQRPNDLSNYYEYGGVRENNIEYLKETDEINRTIVTLACTDPGMVDTLFSMSNYSKATPLHVGAQFHENFYIYLKLICKELSLSPFCLAKINRQRANLQSLDHFASARYNIGDDVAEYTAFFFEALFLSAVTLGIAVIPFAIFFGYRSTHFIYNQATSHSLQGTFEYHVKTFWDMAADHEIYNVACFINGFTSLEKIREVLYQEKSPDSGTASPFKVHQVTSSSPIPSSSSSSSAPSSPFKIRRAHSSTPTSRRELTSPTTSDLLTISDPIEQDLSPPTIGEASSLLRSSPFSSSSSSSSPRSILSNKNHFEQIFLPTIEYILAQVDEDAHKTLLMTYHNATPFTVEQAKKILPKYFENELKGNDDSITAIRFTPPVTTGKQGFFKSNKPTYQELCNNVIKCLKEEPELFKRIFDLYIERFPLRSASTIPVDTSTSLNQDALYASEEFQAL